MMSHFSIYQRIKSVVPAELLARYDHLSYGEMAECAELTQWADELRRAEAEWNRAGPESFA